MARRLHWKREAADLIRLVDPGAAGKPLYLLAAGEVRGRFCPVPQVRGFTAWPLCHELRAAIGARWSGPGFCAVLCRKRLNGRRVLLAIALHEYAHYVTRHGGALLAMFEDSVIGPLLRPPLKRRPGGGMVPGYTVETFDVDHGPPFYRIAAHIAYRSWRLWGGSLVELVGSLHCTLLSHPLAYAAALGDEPARRAGEPLAAIAASDPPAVFAEFARKDAARVARHFARNEPHPLCKRP
jgi:hypothetical protein